MQITNRTIKEDLSLKIIHRETLHGTNRRFQVRLPVFEVLGFAFYLGWVFILYWGIPLAPLNIFSDANAHILRISLAASVAVIYLLSGIFAKPLASRLGHALLIVCALVFSSTNGMVLLVGNQMSFDIYMFAWIITGIGHGFVLILWSKHLVLFSRKQLILITSVAFTGAGLVFLVISYLQPLPSVVASSLLPIISLVFFVFGSRDADERIAIMKQETIPQTNRHNLVQLYIYAFSYCLALGFMESCVSMADFQQDSIVFVAMANCIGGIVMVVLLIRFKRDVARILATFCLPCMAAGMFLFVFTDSLGRLFCIAFLFFIFSCNDIINTTTVSKSSGLYGINFVRTFGFGRFPNAFGVLCGWVMGQLVFFYSPVPNLGMIFVGFLVVVLFVFANVATFTARNRSDTTDSGPAFAPEQVLDAQKSARRRKDVIDAYIAQHNVEDVKTLFLDRATLAAQMLIDEYNLSNRQAEVLMYLAHGRNAEWIQEKLIVSNHTVKSHIYAIYRKLDVHSQQELLDRIEAQYELLHT